MSAETWLGWHQLALGLAVVALVVLAARGMRETLDWAVLRNARLAERAAELHAENDALRVELYAATLPPGWIDGELARPNGEGGIQGRG